MGVLSKPQGPKLTGGRGREGGRDTEVQREEAGRERDRARQNRERQRDRDRRKEKERQRKRERNSLSIFSLYEACVCLLKRTRQFIQRHSFNKPVMYQLPTAV